MRLRSLITAFSAMALGAGVFAQTPATNPVIGPGPGFILGRVVDAGTNQPVSGAVVTLALVNSATGGGGVARGAGTPVLGQESLTTRLASTNSEGHFLFRDLAGGRFNLTVAAIGYADGGYLQIRPNSARVVFELGENEKRGDVELKLWKFGAINGTVNDERGEPVVDATVRLYVRAVQLGRVRLALVTTAVTDDRGAYRFGNLTPRDYFIGVVSTASAMPTAVADAIQDAAVQNPGPRAPRLLDELKNNGVFSFASAGFRVGDLVFHTASTALGAAPPQPGEDGRMLIYQTTFYPNAATTVDALPITLGSGEDRMGIDLSLRLVPTVRVSGVLMTPDGPAKNMGIQLVPPPGDQFTPLAASTVTDANGAFTFLGVRAGSYTLKATRSMIVRTGPPSAADRMLWAAQPLVVGDRDIAGLNLAMRPGLTVAGRIEFRGSTPAPSMQGLNVGTASLVTGMSERASMAIVAANSTFITNGDLPGPYFVYTYAPPGWAIQSISYGGRDVADAPIDLSADVTGLVITLVDKVSLLSGTVVDAKGAPESRGSVIIFPADSDGWRRGEFSGRRARLIAVRTGTFEFRLIPPGRYYAVAVEEGAIEEWTDPRVLDKLTTLATRVTVGEGESQTVALKTVAIK